MRLHFNQKLVRQLLEHAKAATEHRLLYEDKKTNKPGLWLVGDDGVYLMSNGKPPLLKPDSTPEKSHNVVAYARECNPDILSFDSWWANKRRSFGDDDGCDFLAATDIEEALKTYPSLSQPLMMEVTSEQIAIVIYSKVASPTTPPPRRPARASFPHVGITEQASLAQPRPERKGRTTRH